MFRFSMLLCWMQEVQGVEYMFIGLGIFSLCLTITIHSKLKPSYCDPKSTQPTLIGEDFEHVQPGLSSFSGDIKVC